MVCLPFHGTPWTFDYLLADTMTSRCRQTLTVEALGWVEFSLCLFTVLATWIWVSAEDEGSLVRALSWTCQVPSHALLCTARELVWLTTDAHTIHASEARRLIPSLLPLNTLFTIL